ncbi:class I SAM-dependent methyltransferase [Paenibacillus doosanensis]|uniref:Ubiquinone/menaquinone biosynthesis methyltransferase n=1 Tax=Paenibacillus konkukensis TaxID=2020716 RepID=A0ABY4S1A2_9BACL|nr:MULTISPECIES: class I SAM-dependent methyltransferase [Paenibacillus]MCS7460461.1 class I SAM-dependent methyltransferase [Paenibacillus doosanensis]UQZ87491.1 ubiquinone/menaquinone biosynthesis methyltransferase [Paenibacillus konkukensis]
MPNHDLIYQEQAEKYDQLISKQLSLLPYVTEIRDVRGLDIVDLGAGTGRFSSVLAPYARSVLAVDRSEAMLQIAARKLRETAAGCRWTTRTAAGHSAIPAEDRSADLIIAGWTVCYAVNRHVADWESNLETIMGEMKRVLRPGGTIIIWETMGTGHETPEPPAFLTEYYSLLVSRYGFSHRWVRTDYQFESLAQAEELAQFFFGDDVAEQIARHNWVRLPECAGMWWLHL